MVSVRQYARRILSAGAIAGLATLGACAGSDPTSPRAQLPTPTVSHDDPGCATGWVVIDGVLVCRN